MTRRLRFDNGTLLEEWDDQALIHGELRDGVWETRPYTEDEKPPGPTSAPDPLGQGLDELTVALLAVL